MLMPRFSPALFHFCRHDVSRRAADFMPPASMAATPLRMRQPPPITSMALFRRRHERHAPGASFC